MNTETISTRDPNSISRAAHVLAPGGLVAFPTDTVYGLAADVNNAAAIEKLFAAKGRDFNKAIAVLIGRQEQLENIAAEFPSDASRLARRFWPGALTLVVQRHPSLPTILSPRPTIGIRMPALGFTLDLLRQTGPLATTSANLSGGKDPITANDVYAQLNGRVELIIDGGECPGGVPSTVVDCTVFPFQILRTGAISTEEILAALSADA